MPPPTMLTAVQLARLVGLPDGPMLIDLRSEAERADDPRLLPGAERRNASDIAIWAGSYANDQHVIAVCQRGLALSQGVAAWLRHAGVRAESLEGGFEAWAASGATLVRLDKIPPRDAKVDRIACPWLIRRFVDRSAVFLFVSPVEVPAVAERFAATPFDVDGVFWSHRGDLCTFDVMLEEFGLHSAALDRLAPIVRGADTNRLDLAPQAAGLLAASLGLSRMHRDDLVQLDTGLALYDAFYRWSRDATEEEHNWPMSQGDNRPARKRTS